MIKKIIIPNGRGFLPKGPFLLRGRDEAPAGRERRRGVGG
jgi:hypothetical protein